jgi:hypothetical protein
MDGQIIAASPAQNIWHELHPDILQSQKSAGETPFQNNENLSWREELVRGLVKYAHNIRIDGREMGTLFLGPVFHAQPGEDVIRQLAHELDFDEPIDLEKVKRVPVVTEEQAQSYVEFLVQLIQGMAKKGLGEKQNCKVLMMGWNLALWREQKNCRRQMKLCRRVNSVSGLR